jgi:hypothetical protein
MESWKQREKGRDQGSGIALESILPVDQFLQLDPIFQCFQNLPK